MRRIVLTPLLAVLSLAFAPAPFPKAERRPREPEHVRQVWEYDARLRELGVTWELVTDGNEQRDHSFSHRGSSGPFGPLAISRASERAQSVLSVRHVRLDIRPHTPPERFTTGSSLPCRMPKR
jgi:hypothetical protein